MNRCSWCTKEEIYVSYHDNEWGVPVHDDQKIFEAIVLDGFQAGLSWLTILKKRENFRKAFKDFNPSIIATFSTNEVNQLMQDKGIVRNKQKILATISNAICFMQVQKEFGSFDQYIWQFTGHKTIVNKWQDESEIPAKTKESEEMSKDMKKRGFQFCGPTICYAFMQAIGMVNDHIVGCYRYKALS